MTAGPILRTRARGHPSQTLDEATDDYALGRSEAETARLIRQHQIYGPITRQLLTAAGITSGMRVLDVGSGAGDVALLLADLVGPSGQVVGVDMNGEILDTARARVRATGWSNVQFVQGDVRDRGQHDQLGSGFDAVVGRWILMYLPDPADFIRRCAARLRAGGIVTFIESDLRSGAQTFPPAPLHEELARWMTPEVDLPGPQPTMGPLLFSTFLAAGLPTPELRMAAPVGGGPDWPGYAYLAESVRSLLPFMEQVGVVPPGSVEVDSLEERLRAEVVERDGIQQLPSVIGAWSRRTS